MFYGRTEELNFLESKYNSNKSEFIIIYGRRRIGKTELLKQFSNGFPHVFYVGRECTNNEQLEAFTRVLLAGNPSAKYIKFDSWENVFRYIGNISEKEKKLIIFDEFPYAVYSDKSLPSVIQLLWDEVLKDSNLMIILCGSSMSFIEKELLSEKAPLYGRTTGIYKILDLDLSVAGLFLSEMSFEDKIISYSILGGIPHYLKQFDSKKSIDENIKENILAKGCTLYSEVEFILKQELRETSKYYSVIEAVAMGNTKLNQISSKTQIEARSLSTYLGNLIELGIVLREYPITDSIKSKVSLHSGIYKIKDNFFSFYFRFVFPFNSEIETGNIDIIYETEIAPNLNQFVGNTFETVCIQFLRNMNRNKKYPFRFTQIGRWWSKDNEIDIIGLEQKTPSFFAECKWKNSKMSIGDYKHLIEKLEKTQMSIKNPYILLFSKSGFENNLLEISKNDENLMLIDLNKMKNDWEIV